MARDVRAVNDYNASSIVALCHPADQASCQSRRDAACSINRTAVARGTRLYMKGVVRLLCVGHILNSTDQTAIDGAGARHQFASIRAT